MEVAMVLGPETVDPVTGIAGVPAVGELLNSTPTEEPEIVLLVGVEDTIVIPPVRPMPRVSSSD